MEVSPVATLRLVPLVFAMSGPMIKCKETPRKNESVQGAGKRMAGGGAIFGAADSGKAAGDGI